MPSCSASAALRNPDRKEGGSRIAIIMNGSPLFTGDAGSGDSDIRGFVLENDLLEALIALAEYLFAAYTAIWILMFVYLRVLARRNQRLEKEIEELHILIGKR